MHKTLIVLLLTVAAHAQPDPPRPPKPPKPPSPIRFEGKDWNWHWSDKDPDAALYRQSIDAFHQGRTADATSALDTLTKSYPNSRWTAEAAKLRTEMAHTASRKLTPEQIAEEDELKITAARSLMDSSPDRAIPLVEKMLERRLSPRQQQRALELFLNSQHPKAREISIRVAKGGANPDLQMRALRRLGADRSPENLQLLESIYRGSSDTSIKAAVLQAYVSAGDAQRLVAVAKSDTNTEMRRRAIQHLSHMKSPEATDYLLELLK